MLRLPGALQSAVQVKNTKFMILACQFNSMLYVAFFQARPDISGFKLWVDPGHRLFMWWRASPAAGGPISINLGTWGDCVQMGIEGGVPAHK